jgi:hypothetical protein
MNTLYGECCGILNEAKMRRKVMILGNTPYRSRLLEVLWVI